MRRIPLVLLTVAALASTAATAARDDKGSKTGCFEVRTTLVELLGEEGAKNFSESLELDKRMSWQLYVPPAYSAEDPPGIIVFVSANRRGAGDGADPDGDYCAARPARRLRGRLQSKLRRGLLGRRNGCVHSDDVKAGAVSGRHLPRRGRGLGDETPPKIELIRKNRHTFLIGANDDDLKEMQRVFNRCKMAGVENIELIRMRNNQNSWPAGEFLGRAIDQLDDRDRSAASSD